MTKKDGDRLRAMRDEVLAMAKGYEPKPTGTNRALTLLANEIDLTIRGRRDRVQRLKDW